MVLSAGFSFVQPGSMFEAATLGRRSLADLSAKMPTEACAELASVVGGSQKPASLPSHVEEALQAMAAMHAAHHEKASPMERSIDNVTAGVAAPKFVGYVSVFIILWLFANYALYRAHTGFSDAPAFTVLNIAIECSALLIAILILASQRRADKLANLREQMTLEMSLLTTQKVSKLIDLVEELRRDSPDVKDRIDLEAIEMAGMPDHKTVLQAIQEISETAGGVTAS
jgi:uncharacterized membrane protein